MTTDTFHQVSQLTAVDNLVFDLVDEGYHEGEAIKTHGIHHGQELLLFGMVLLVRIEID